MHHVFVWTMLAAAVLPGQTLDLYSEFLRTGPTGEVVAADRTPNPREILSPAVVRGGYASFQVVVRSARANYFLFTAANPADSVLAVIWREQFANVNGQWIPDRLTPTRETMFDVIPDPETAIPGQSARCYLLDVWVPRETPAGRLRLEVQIKAGSWSIYPMEVRVLPPVVPKTYRSAAPLPEIDSPSADAVLGPLQDFIAGRVATGRVNRTSPATVREVLRRNAEQDVALAPKRLAGTLKEKLGKQPAHGEWYLALRDWIYREAGGRE
jgi:hypothetical protein